MNLKQRLDAFEKLGLFLNEFTHQTHSATTSPFTEGLQQQVKLAHQHNKWFTQQNVHLALKNWAKALTKGHLNTWLSAYNFDAVIPKTVAVILAGNIPLVGFHDVVSVLISGHNVIIKPSSTDKQLLPYLLKYLEYVQPKFKGKISITTEKLKDFDAVIATGSNNTARYFEYYFKGKPAIIRKNRNSIAILTGNESEKQLKGLADDIFTYFGLGCRSVSKLFVPKCYNFEAFFKGIYHWHSIINNAKYANNYDYNKAVYLMSEFDMLENGFFMIKEDTSSASPIATAFFEYYTDKETLQQQITENKNNIQCVVSNGFFENEVAFGNTQNPQLWDYADNVDTIAFLLKI